MSHWVLISRTAKVKKKKKKTTCKLVCFSQEGLFSKSWTKIENQDCIEAFEKQLRTIDGIEGGVVKVDKKALI